MISAVRACEEKPPTSAYPYHTAILELYPLQSGNLIITALSSAVLYPITHRHSSKLVLESVYLEYNETRYNTATYSIPTRRCPPGQYKKIS